jgi:hypothetical protein
MTQSSILKSLSDVLLEKRDFTGNFLSLQGHNSRAEQLQTNAAFSKKWDRQAINDGQEKAWILQKNWYLVLCGFKDETELSVFLRGKAVICDAGAAYGTKLYGLPSLHPIHL